MNTETDCHKYVVGVYDNSGDVSKMLLDVFEPHRVLLYADVASDTQAQDDLEHHNASQLSFLAASKHVVVVFEPAVMESLSVLTGSLKAATTSTIASLTVVNRHGAITQRW